ncbi:MAG: hydrogenase formation protein HypD [Bacteroidales bacterium]|nr:hydrogenase formation protein HypD [Bacteroidales bacterium]
MMKHADKTHDREQMDALAEQIGRYKGREIALREVCGDHTRVIRESGILSLLPPRISLGTGPGCPVCAGGRVFIDKTIAFARLKGVILATFGHLMPVPGSTSSLKKEKEAGLDIRVIHSVRDALLLAKDNPVKKVIFVATGFENSAPATAAAIVNASMAALNNFFVYSAHKCLLPAMAALMEEGIKTDGFIVPWHIASITGTDVFGFLPEKYGAGCVIAGFDPVDVLESALMLIKQVAENRPVVELQSKKALSPEGNSKAKAMTEEVFVRKDDYWQGFGVVAASGMQISGKYSGFDAEAVYHADVEPLNEANGCICGGVFK